MKHSGSDITHELDGRKLISYCVKHGARAEFGSGDHCKVYYRNSMEVIPARPIGCGLQHRIVKWIRAVGLVAAVIGTYLAFSWAF